ncbi:MAG: ATP-binding protein, partial [Pyrinomonadaceae bacterium]
LDPSLNLSAKQRVNSDTVSTFCVRLRAERMPAARLVMNIDPIFRSKLFTYTVSVAAVIVAAIALGAFTDHVNSTTVALTLLLIVLSSATFFGRNPALLASFVAMLCFNYFFLPPFLTWTIAEPPNLIAWAAFTITAIVAGELSAYASRRAREAERLYEELQGAFEAATQAEALKQSEKLKSALLDAVTHDLRTPLTSIKAAVTTILESEGGHRTIELDSGGRAEFLNIINEETDRLNGFIESMVALARLEAGSVNESGSPTNVEEILIMALDRAGKDLADHRVDIDIGEDLPLIRVDARATAEVFYNLIENAVKYSGAGTAIIIAAVENDASVVISVTDQGKGIPVDMRERVFEKFVRLEGTAADGLGLGLSIARGIVEAQKGTISIRSADTGSGTKVTVTLPAEQE